MPAVMTDACGPKSPDSHRVVWGLTSWPPVPLRAFLRFPVCPPGSSPSPAFLWFPVVRRSPVRLLRPLPGFRFPFGFPPGSLLRATLMLALPRGDSAGVGPGRQGPRSPVPPRPLAWIARSAALQICPASDRCLAPRLAGAGWIIACTDDPVTIDDPGDPRSRSRCSMPAPVASDTRSPFSASRESSACPGGGPSPAATSRAPSSLRSWAVAPL